MDHLSDDELVELNQELGRQQDAIRAQRLGINKELSARHSVRVAEEVLAGLHDDVVRVIMDRAGVKAGGKPLSVDG